MTLSSLISRKNKLKVKSTNGNYTSHKMALLLKVCIVIIE